MGRRLIQNPVYWLVYLAFFLFILLPILSTFVSNFADGKTLQKSLSLVSSKTFLLLGKSIWIASWIALLSTLGGTALGYFLYKTDVAGRKFFKIALLLPLFISPYIFAVAWQDFFYLFGGQSQAFTSYVGMILVLTFIYTPLSMLIVGNAFTNIDSHLEETGLLITPYPRVLMRIVLPLIRPALATSFVLIFILSIAEFSVPAFFGVRVFTTEIFTQFAAFYNHSLATLQSTFLILACVVLLILERKQLEASPFFSLGGRGTISKIHPLNKHRSLVTFALAFWFFLSVVLPFVTLLFQSAQEGLSPLVRAFALLSPTFWNSVSLALIGALLSTLLGLLSAYQSEVKNSKALEWLLLLGFIVPSTVLGIGLIKFYNTPTLDFIYSSSAIILLGYLGKFSFISSKIIGNAIKQIPKSLDEAAKIQGIGKYSRFTRLLLPLITPALLAALVITFIFCLGELGTTILVYPPGTELMPVKLYTLMANAPQSLTSSMTLIIFTFTLLMISIIYLLLRPLTNKTKS